MMAAPSTTGGIEMVMPRMSSSRLPLAAAATAMTLSRLITASATMTTHTACQIDAEAAMPASCSDFSGRTSLMAIHMSSALPASISKGMRSRNTMMTAKMILRTMAASVPSPMPQRRFSGGRPRQASAITSALSPPSTMLMVMISMSASQNPGETTSSISLALGDACDVGRPSEIGNGTRDQRPQQHDDGERGDRPDERVGEEHHEIAVAGDHCLAEGGLRNLAEHQRHHKRRKRVVELFEDIADDAEDQHQQDVEIGIGDRE